MRQGAQFGEVASTNPASSLLDPSDTTRQSRINELSLHMMREVNNTLGELETVIRSRWLGDRLDTPRLDSP